MREAPTSGLADPLIRSGELAGRLERDLGPVYRETDLGRFPVEPWATASNLVFLVLALYWARRLRGRWRAHPMLTAALPILLIGWVGGTVYHATRSHPAWLLMDWMPIALLLVMAGFTLWRRLTGRGSLALPLTFLPLFLSGAVMRSGIPINLRITLNYALMGTALALPAVLHCALKFRRGWPWLAGATASFAAALLFRQWDLAASDALPMGTHFLWHLFGGGAAFGVFGYIFHDAERA